MKGFIALAVSLSLIVGLAGYGIDSEHNKFNNCNAQLQGALEANATLQMAYDKLLASYEKLKAEQASKPTTEAAPKSGDYIPLGSPEGQRVLNGTQRFRAQIKLPDPD